MAWWAIYNILLIICLVIKLVSLLRFFQIFSRFVALVGKVFYDTVPFMMFFIGAVYVFSLILMASGMIVEENSGHLGDDSDETDYPILGRGVKFALYTYQNSVGELSTPKYPYWISHIEENKKTSWLMINIIWMFWFLN